MKEWRFDGGAAGWEARNEVRLSVEGGELVAEPTGGDPYFAASASAESGEYVLRFRAARNGVADQVFWWTEEEPQTAAARQTSVEAAESPRGSVYEVKFRSEGRLAGVRIDTDPESGPVHFGWIELVAADSSSGGQASTDVVFRTVPSTPVTFEVSDNGQRAVAAFEIRDARGRNFPLQIKRLAPDFFFHPQIYRGTPETRRYTRPGTRATGPDRDSGCVGRQH